MVASYIVVGVMAVLALGLLEPANIAVLVELKKPRPNPAVIERLMKRFIYCAGHPRRDADRDARDHDQAGVRMNERQLPPVTQLGMASLALIVAGGIYLSAHLPQHVPLGPAVALLAASALLLRRERRGALARPGLRLGAVLRGRANGPCSPTS